MGVSSPLVSIQPGNIDFFAAVTAPAGWIKANGAAVSRTTYALLFAAIGTVYGGGDGVTTFNVPDLRGEFVRGFDDGRGIDTGRVLGSAQADEFRSHTHGIAVASDRAPGGGGALATANEGIQSTAKGGTETRPRNIAMLACLKY